ncbi:MAG TPA: hypothetical protein PLR99_21820 [Polyangiaceae bacterium]|nr:hypothetical protein [Polyangiaceae bacterium]
MKSWMMTRWGGAAALAVVAASLGGCDKDKKEAAGEVVAAPTASALAPSTAAPTSMVVKMKLRPAGTTSIDMPAPKEHIKAQTTVAAGNLDVDLMDLSQTRGEVKVDLTSLKTATFGDATKDGTQTMHALTWLEVGDAEKEKLPEAVKAANKFAVFAIRSIDGLAVKDLAKVAPATDKGQDVRTVELVAHGELLIHGHKVNKDVPLVVKISHPAGAATTTKPTSIGITTKEPLKVVLAEHEVRPRDDVGKIAKAAFNLIGTKVADSASISMDFSAVPAD